jgi:hypothetical protein
MSPTKPAPAQTSTSTSGAPFRLSNTALMIGAAALALAALVAALVALRNRRKIRQLAEYEAAHPVESHEPEPAWHAPAPAASTAPAEASAFAWGQPSASERKMTRVERARIGPTPDNPSLSLKKRLKRAAFFDQRDREMAAGNAVPVDADAGLPESVAEPAAVSERELKAA